MHTVLLVESSEVMSCGVKAALENDFEVYTCFDGNAASEMLERLKPDYMIINFTLPYRDGLTVLRNARYKPSVILGLSLWSSPYASYSAYQVGVSYVLQLPATFSAVANCLRDLIVQPALPEIRANQFKQTEKHLAILGIPYHMRGYRMLRTAIPLFCQDPHVSLSKELYPTVVSLFGSADTLDSVEHAIRNAIQTAWKERDLAVWQAYFPNRQKQPTNKQFIATIASRIE